MGAGDQRVKINPGDATYSMVTIVINTKRNCALFSGEYVSCVQLFAMPWIIAGQAPLYPWNFPCKNTAVRCHFLLQIVINTML